MKIIYDQRLMQYMTLFENLTKVKVKDVFLRGKVVNYVIFKKDLRKAIGPNGIVIKRLQDMLRKRVKVVAYSENVEEFVKDLVYGFEVSKIENKEGDVKIYCKSSKTKGLLIGRERKNLQDLKKIISRYFEVKNLEVV